MGRENYRSLYGDLTKLKSTPVLNAPITVTDDELWELLLAATETIEQYCNRHFVPIHTTRYYDGNGEAELLISDLLAITTLKEGKGDATFGTTWATTDYHAYPYNAEPTKPWGSAWTSLKVAPNGAYSAFTKGTRNFEIAGKWGYRNYQEHSGTTTTNAGFTAAVTTINVATGGGAMLRVGQTIWLPSITEQMLITAIETDALTVVRGLNGTTAAIVPATLEAIHIVRWPAPVERATLIHAARLYARAPYLEPYYEDADLDTDIRVLLDRYRRLTV